ncbi:MAG: 2-oxoglutarate dehydrogenase E1 component [Armatimonadetes bacterium]|nr:2-oxoglutarate dehydrogenase E1 component [Armatimonadota bacterium]
MSQGQRVPDIANLEFVEDLYLHYLDDPDSVPAHWRGYFAGLTPTANGHSNHPPAPRAESIFNPRGSAVARRAPEGAAQYQQRLEMLIRAYRVRGHLAAHVDPLMRHVARPEELDAAFHGFSEADMDRTFHTGTLESNGRDRTLREIIEHLEETYCRLIGAQFMHMDDLRMRQWLLERMEATRNRLRLTREEQVRILTKLTDAVIFEDFIQRKFVGAKSFSLEGGESLIPLLDLAIEDSGRQGIREIVLGMAHRGRLNVLSNIMGKGPQQIFREFADLDPEKYLGRGDVKYHLGYSSDYPTAAGRSVHLSLCFNPSHLEFANTVAMGRLRAKQDRRGDAYREEGLMVLIHGDAAFAGEGVVQETLNLSRLGGYGVGGAVHVVINNQIGFTTDPIDSRSTHYCTDVAKMLQSPVFHVNGEDPESVAQVVRLALDFRRTFARDVIIDMYCYRRRGHNEGDEPAFTQPLLYAAIEQRKTVREGYLEHLLRLGEVSQKDADAIAYQRQETLEAELAVARSADYNPPVRQLSRLWQGLHGGPSGQADHPDTSLPVEALRDVGYTLTALPDDFTPHPKIKQVIDRRREMARGERPLDWGMGEALAMGTLVNEGFRLRLSGQDSQRGTFGHRHSVLHSVTDGHEFAPLELLGPGRVELLNSPLCEVGVLGFEYGYSLDSPDCLTIWEAQFGDFANVAQVILDQFIASGEDKWGLLSKLVLLLPHGMEGMGPEHSSARVERYLQLAADANWQICWPSTPAQMFHLLRRQMLRQWAKPLVVFTPKSLLRHPAAVSPLEALAGGTYQTVMPDPAELDPAGVQRVLLCSGKIAYELEDRRRQLERTDVAILRLEELYPFPEAELRAQLARYEQARNVYWVQDEPANMGPWRYLLAQYPRGLWGRWEFDGISRLAGASPATGSAASHRLEQERLLTAALGGPR